MNTTKKTETETALFSIENEVLYVKYKANSDVELKDVKINFKARQKIQQDKKMLIFVDVSEVWQFSDEARRFVGKSRLEELTIAMAILTGKSMPVRIMANFFMKLNTPTFPTKLFNSKTKALTWLQKHP